MAANGRSDCVSITELLKQLSAPENAKNANAQDIAAAVALVFEDRLSKEQLALLLWALHTTGLDHQPDVLAACAGSMRMWAAQVDREALRDVVRSKKKAEGGYRGGLCDIVGTGGDGHNTYNVSTTASIIAAPLLMMAKHGNNSSTSLSGSADLLQNTPKPAKIEAITAETLPKIYERTNYAFLYAREWHPGMKHAASVRKEVPVRTIFNLLGPLANPVHDSGLVEARIIGVAREDIGMNFAEALRLSGVKKAFVVCGAENLDELSCAGPTHCWWLHEVDSEQGKKEVEITQLAMSPGDFGLPCHPLSEVHGGKGPKENAEILMRILRNEMPEDDPVLHFVLLNTAALIALSGICETEATRMGAGDNGKVVTERGLAGIRWKEGLRRAKWCITSGAALKEWEAFVEVTHEYAG